MRGARTPITIRTVNTDSVETDGNEGIWIVQEDDIEVVGSVHQNPRATEVNESIIGQIGEQRNIVCRIPLTTVVNYGDQVILDGLNHILNGTYEVTGLTFTKTHIRVLGRRMLKDA